MLLSEIFADFDPDEYPNDPMMVTEGAVVAYARQGKKIVRKYRCTSGKKQGRIVSSPGDCNKAIDPKRRFIARKTHATKGKRMARKRKRTMRANPSSKRLQVLNKSLSKGRRVSPKRSKEYSRKINVRSSPKRG